MTAPTWTNERRRLRDLVPWEHNPKRMSKKQADGLRASLEHFGFAVPFLVSPAGDIYDGHQRQTLMDAMAEYGPDALVDVRVSSRPLTEDERRELVVRLKQNQAGWDFDMLGNLYEPGELIEWGFEESELGFLPDDAESARGIGREGRLYEGHDIEPFKLAHRVEAVWRADGGLALDLFSGAGQLASWYRRRFARVVTVDKDFAVGDVDYSMTASAFIRSHLAEFIDFDFVDFDDEGTPAGEIQEFFSAICGKRSKPFCIALTDGNGLNMKMHGYVDFGKTYLVDGGEKRRATQADYEAFEETVTAFVVECAGRSGFTATQLSSWRGRENNVVFQTWYIVPSGAARCASDCDSLAGGTAADHA